MKIYFIICLCISTCWCEENEKKSEPKNQDKRGIEDGYGSYHGSPAGAVSYSHVIHTHQNQIAHRLPVKNFVKEVPYPVAIEKPVPVPVKVPIPVAVDRPIPVHVPKPYPVQVIKPVPYYVEKPVPVPVKVPAQQPDFILTKVPLVFHATYQDQGHNNQGYNQGFNNQGYNHGFSNQGFSDYNNGYQQYNSGYQNYNNPGHHQQYQQNYPHVAYDRNYDDQHV